MIFMISSALCRTEITFKHMYDEKIFRMTILTFKSWKGRLTETKKSWLWGAPKQHDDYVHRYIFTEKPVQLNILWLKIYKLISLKVWALERLFLTCEKRKKRTFDFNRNFYNKKHHGEDERLNFQISISKSHENDNNLNISFSTAMSMWYDHAKVLRSLIQKELIYTIRYRKNHRWHIWISCTCFAGSLLLRIFLVNMTKSAGNCGFGHTYWRNS